MIKTGIPIGKAKCAVDKNGVKTDCLILFMRNRIKRRKKAHDIS